MGFFSKKEKTQEEKLVKELVGTGFLVSDNLLEVLDTPIQQNRLQKIVKEAWKNGASLNEIQRIYDETLDSFQKNDKSPESFLVDEISINFIDLPTETQGFLDKIKRKPEKICKLSDDFKYVVKLTGKLALGITGQIFITNIDNIEKGDVKSFASTVYNHAYYEEIENTSSGGHRADIHNHGANSGPSTFVILITENISEDDLPKLITGDWTGQTNKAMIYNSSKKTLYGRNGVHMKFFKKNLEEWGVLEDLQNNNKYFSVNML